MRERGNELAKERGGENLPSITSIHGKMKREKETVRKRGGRETLVFHPLPRIRFPSSY